MRPGKQEAMTLPNMQVGTFVLNSELLLYLIAGMVGVLAVRYRQRGHRERERHVAEAWNAILIWLVVWKGSLLLFDPAAVVRHPLSLLFFSGGTKGIWLASLTALSYMYLRNRRRSGSREALTVSATWGAGMLMAAGLGFILFDNSAGAAAYGMLAAGSALTAFLLIPQPRVAAQTLGITLVAVMIAYAVFEPPGSAPVRLDQAAPDFELTDLRGETVRLSDYRGQTVVLNFWTTWCRVCQAEMPHVEKFYREYADRGVVVLSVNATSQERNAALAGQYAEQEALSFPILLDKRGDVLDMYRVSAYPTTYIVNPAGHIQERYLGALSYESMKKAVKAVG